MSRRIPRPLYDEVFELVTMIAQPDASPLENVDEAAASEGMRKLLEVYRRQESSGAPDPYLTEAVADFTEDATEAIQLYELALIQSAAVPGEPIASKHIGLARRLHDIGRTKEAREHLLLARQSAFAERDAKVLQEMDELDKAYAL